MKIQANNQDSNDSNRNTTSDTEGNTEKIVTNKNSKNDMKTNTTTNYVSGDSTRSSSSHQFHDKDRND